MRNCRFIPALTLLLCVFSSPAFGQEDESTWSIALDSITVRGHRYKSPVKSNAQGVTFWDMSNMILLPQILGNADPMHYSQMLPGIQTNGEYRCGINIEGCENQHNTISIEGVPIYNVNHLLGFFSTFNSSHYPSMSISKGSVGAVSPNRLGGQLDMLHSTDVSDSLSGNLSLGLISSQGTIDVPIDSRTSMKVSLRGSYMNLLYSQWMKADDQQVRYSFNDANVTLLHHLNDSHIFLLDYYAGGDNAAFEDRYYLADMKTRWGNYMGALHWIYNDDAVAVKTTAYATAYRNRFSLEMEDMTFRLPSGITDIGLKNRIAWKKWDVGADVTWHDIRPQSVVHHGNLNLAGGSISPMRSLEASLMIDYKQEITNRLSLSSGLRGSLFCADDIDCCALDPSLRLTYEDGTYSISASYALRHQYLFQTGFSDSGLPTEFWISASKDYKPQYAHEVSLSGSIFLLNRRYKLTGDMFYRRLYHQLGYKGSVLDYVNSVYDLRNAMMHGRGRNYGFSIMLNKCSGPLTGWISYTYTHARRSFDEEGRRDSYPASHERPHELNAVATCELGKHWSVGGTMVYASGTPFTEARSLFLLNNNLIVKYGDYNAARLRAYFRFDLSSTYKWIKKKGTEQGLNVSLYNVTSHDNDLFYYLSTHGDGSFAYRPVSFVLRILPSLSYYYKF